MRPTTAALLVALVACAGPGTAPEPEPLPGPTPGAATPAGAETPEAPVSELVDAEDHLIVDGFARCGVRDPQGRDVTTQLVFHVEGPTGQHAADVVDALAVDAVRRRASHLLGNVPGMDPDAVREGFACESIAAPDGDVDWEITVRFGDDGAPRLSLVDVARRAHLMPAAARGTSRCERDAMGTMFCAEAPEGVAVSTTLGAIACARGQCVKHRGQWWCARAAGGWAEVGPRGPECEQGCYPPTGRQCRRT